MQNDFIFQALLSNLLSAIATFVLLTTLPSTVVKERPISKVERSLQVQDNCCVCKTSEWALEETFTGNPTAPSQDLLPRYFDYVVTHRTHPAEHFTKMFPLYPADHSSSCAGPDPNVSPLPQHYVQTSHTSNGINPDTSFFVCKDHMMSSMGDVEGYSVTAFWPKQEFNFASGTGVLEFDVNLNLGHPRSWWEVLLMPRSELKVGAAKPWLPISETYPKDHILLDFDNNKRSIKVGTGLLPPEGWYAEESLWWNWQDMFPNDPALTDRRIRRKFRVEIAKNGITWGIETQDGTLDNWTVTIPAGLPFSQALVVFKTHAYTPNKDGNFNNFTFHWDNIRFNGPIVGKYVSYEASDVVYLQSNGNRAIGDSQTVYITLPSTIGPNPVLFGQIHNPIRGQVLLSINGGNNIQLSPYDYETNDCYSGGWSSFRYTLEPSKLILGGNNAFKWTVGPRPSCLEGWEWDGFSVKFLQIQADSTA